MAVALTDLADQIVRLYGPAFVTTLTTKVFLLTRLQELGLVREGRPSLDWQVNYAANSAVGSYGEGDTAAGSGKQLFKKATLGYKSVRAEIGMTGQALAVSEAGGLFVDQLRTEIDNGLRDMRKSIETQVLSDGTGNSGKDITGLRAAIGDTGTYAGLDRGSYVWWKAYVNANGGTPRNLSEALIAAVMDEVLERGADLANVEIWCGPTQWRNFGGLYKGERRQTPTSLTGGYQKLDFEGVPVIKVPGYTAARMDVVDRGQLTYEMLPVTANTALARELRNVIAVPGIPGFGILLLGAVKDQLELWLIHYAQLKCANPYVMGSIQDLA